MSEEDFQRAKKLQEARTNYLEGLASEYHAKSVSQVYYSFDNVWSPFIGYSSMEVPFNLLFVIVRPWAFENDFVRVEDDFLSMLLDHEAIHVRQHKNKPGLAIKKFYEPALTNRVFTLDLEFLEIPNLDRHREAHWLRRSVFCELHRYATSEVEAYEYQLNQIKLRRRKCSDEFIKKMRERLTIYRDVS